MKCNEANTANYNRNDVSGRSGAFPWESRLLFSMQKEYRIEHCSHEIDVHVTEHERNRSISPLNVKEDDSFVLLRDCWLIQLLKATFVRKDGEMN